MISDSSHTHERVTSFERMATRSRWRAIGQRNLNPFWLILVEGCCLPWSSSISLAVRSRFRENARGKVDYVLPSSVATCGYWQ